MGFAVSGMFCSLLCECLHRSRIRNDYFDYRGFGESDGERGRLVPAMQTEDIISVINWAEKQECIDNQRIGLWGTSLGGGMSSVQLRRTNA